MNQANTLSEPFDYPPSSGMSEVDSLSDSDWLEISSGHESDDNDSVSSQDSDRAGSMPPSRRSSISLGSSRDGEVEAWEGFVDDSADEDVLPVEAFQAITTVANGGETTITSLAFIPPTEADSAEDQRVREALDQSMMGTLSSSRSSSSGGHQSTTLGSLRDLRLSFPDPLTSSHDELNRSYEDVSPSETTFSATDGEDIAPTMFQAPPAHEDDPGLITTPEVPHHEITPHDCDIKSEYDIVLYGSNSSVKWSFVQDLVRKAVTVSDRTLTSSSQFVNGSTRWLHIERHISPYASLIDTVAVHDRTERSFTPSAFSRLLTTSYRPSLGVVYLPSAVADLPEHTFYIPVVVPTAPALDDNGVQSEAVRKAAQADWKALSIPSSKVIRLRGLGESPLVDGAHQVEPLRAHLAIRRLVTQAKKQPRPVFKAISEQLTSANAVTLFALVSLVMGFAVNIAFRSPAPSPTSTERSLFNNISGMFAAVVNHSVVAQPSTVPPTTAIICASPKDFAVSVFQAAQPPSAISSPPVSSLSIISPPGSVAVVTKTPELGDCKVSTRSERAKSLKDILLPVITTQISVSEVPSKAVITVAPPLLTTTEQKPVEMTTSLGPKLVDSLQEVLSDNVKAIAEVVNQVHQEHKDLVDALDNLLTTVREQSKAVAEQSKEKAQILRDRVQYRNDRAKGKARELKAKGERLLSLASEQINQASEQINFKARTAVAKRRARKFTESVMTSEAWYRKVHQEWAEKLKENSKEDASMRQDGRGSRRGTCNEKTHPGGGRRMKRMCSFSYGWF